MHFKNQFLRRVLEEAGGSKQVRDLQAKGEEEFFIFSLVPNGSWYHLTHQGRYIHFPRMTMAQDFIIALQSYIQRQVNRRLAEREGIIEELVYLEWSVFGSLKRIEQAIDAGRLVGYVTVHDEYADPYGHAARLDQSYGRSLQARARFFQWEDHDTPSLLEQLIYRVRRDETPATSPILRYLKQDILPRACLRFLTRSQFWVRKLSASFLPMHPFQHVLAFLEQRGREQPEQVADHLVMLALRMNKEKDLFHLMKGEQLLRLHKDVTEKLKELHEGPVSDNTVWQFLCILFGEWVSAYGALIGDIEAEEPSWERGVLTETGAKQLGSPHLANCLVDYEPHPLGGFAKSIYHQGERIDGTLQIGEGGILPEESGV